jgi:hypothetical protein
LERVKMAKAKEAVRVALLFKEQEDAKMQAEEKLRQAARSVALLKEQEEASRLSAAAKEEEKERRRVAAKLVDIAEQQEEEESRYAVVKKEMAEKAKVRDREKAKLADIMLSRNIRQLSAEAKQAGMKSGKGGSTTTGSEESKVMEDSARALDAVKEKTSWAEAENNARPAYVSKKDADRNARQALLAKNKEEGGRLALMAEKKALEKERVDMLKKRGEEELNEKAAAVARKEAEKAAILAVENELAEIAKAEALALQMSSGSTVQKELDMNQSAFTIESDEE